MEIIEKEKLNKSKLIESLILKWIKEKKFYKIPKFNYIS